MAAIFYWWHSVGVLLIVGSIAKSANAGEFFLNGRPCYASIQ